MEYIKSKKYDRQRINERMMGPNPIKLAEELLQGHRIAPGACVMDLGSGQGITSLFLAKEYGFRVFAADLWSDPGENMRFFEREGLSSAQIVPIHADANDLPFATAFFDAVVSIDAYHYFGRDARFLGEKLLPYVKRGGDVYIAVPGMKRDCHDDLPPVLLLSWTPEDLQTIRDVAYWEGLLRQTPEAQVLCICEMQSNEAVWGDWLACDNDYARGDRKAMQAGGGAFLNFIAMHLRKK